MTDETSPMIARRRMTTALLMSMLTLAGCARDTSHVTGSGTIEMDEVDVASLVGGRVVRLAVQEGDSVRAGDTLAVLDRGEVAADLENQRALTARAEAQLRDLTAGPRAAEIRAARAELDGATSQARFAANDFERVSRLARDQLVAPADSDRARNALDSATARRDAAAEQLTLLEQGSRREQVAAAQQAVEGARAQIAASRSRVGELTLRAPISGTVLVRDMEPGELALPGIPILTLGNPDSLWMRVYVAAPELPRVRLGAAADVRVLGVSQPFRGRVVEIARVAEFTPRAALTEEEKANLVFGVKIVLESSHGALKAGLPAEARIVAAAPGRP